MAEVTTRKKSPRAPSLALDEAIERTLKVYEREHLHAAPIDVVAQHMGYKNAGNGSALSTLASLRYFGLLERPREGFLAVGREFESFRFAPDEMLKRSLLVGFLKRPTLYSELLERYASGLPSDANLRFDLIQRGFTPAAAESALSTFKRSVAFVGHFEVDSGSASSNLDEEGSQYGNSATQELSTEERTAKLESDGYSKPQLRPVSQVDAIDADLDRIPVRLPGGRRAYLLIPSPFFNADKARLKAQIDLLLTEEEEDA